MERETQAYYRTLLDKYQRGEATEAEIALVHAYYRAFDARRGYTGQLDDTDRIKLKDELYTAIQARAGLHKHRKISGWLPYAAAVIVFLAIGSLFLDKGLINKEEGLTITEIQPGGSRATLILADGSTIELSEAQTGIVVGDGITYLDGSAVMNNAELRIEDGEAVFNSITTPKGGTYQITLPDGSRVWLNAASTLKYPSRFADDERVVELEGEAYFDIRQQTLDTRQQTKRPFKVMTSGLTVQVLGTQFNISAYADEAETKTTLVAGKVRLSADATGASVSLVPGEQGRLVDGTIETKQVDTEPYTAWKDGKFVFEQEPLESIMKKLARWYDVEVVYAGNKTYSTFTGSISRQEHIGEILEKIRFTQAVDFKIEGRRITVM